MRAATTWRGKALIAIIAIAVLLLALSLVFQPDGPDATNAPPAADASATNDMSAQRTALPSDEKTTHGVVSGVLTNDEQTSPSGSSNQENRARNDTQLVDANATSAVDSTVEPKREAKPGSVEAECWGLRGSARSDFVVTLDREVRTTGEASALISSRRDTSGYATMFQTAAAGPVRGKRVEFTADIRTRGATGGANLLLRAEDAYGNPVAFDNMVTGFIGDQRPYRVGNRGITGDSEWSTQHVIVDIPDEARVITYGVSMFGSGKAWIDNARIEVVTNEMATTAPDIRQSPTPLNVMSVNPASLTRSPRNLGFDLEAQAGAAPCN
jgi:hypothetical protein